MLHSKDRQRYNQIDNSHKRVFIRIDTAQTPQQPQERREGLERSVHDLLSNELELTKRRVVKGKIVLEDSRRQDKSVRRVVESDRMGITFNYVPSQRSIEKNSLAQAAATTVDESGARETQGGIQLPLHLQASPGGQLTSARRRFDEIDFSRSFDSSRTTERINCLTAGEGSLEKKLQWARKLTEKRSKHKMQNILLGFRRSKDRSKQHQSFRQSINNSLQSKDTHRTRNQLYFLNQSQDKLPISDRERSKEKLQKIIKTASKQHDKIKITKNRPKLSQTCHFSSTNIKMKPRYQICVPRTIVPEFSREKEKKEVSPTNEWDQLKRKIQRHEFVRKHIKQAELFKIYEHLKKNRIHPDKWPMFVIEQAYKKMSSSKR